MQEQNNKVTDNSPTTTTQQQPQQTQPDSPDQYYSNGTQLSASAINAIIQSKIVKNKDNNKIALIIGIFSAGSIISILFFLNYLGNQSTSYSYVSGLSNDARLLGLLLAGILGSVSAYMMAHPTHHRIGRTKKLNTAHPIKPTSTKLSNVSPVVLVISGFLLGSIPGFIISVIISYPLSQRACQLSGSKYC